MLIDWYKIRPQKKEANEFKITKFTFIAAITKLG